MTARTHARGLFACLRHIAITVPLQFVRSKKSETITTHPPPKHGFFSHRLAIAPLGAARIQKDYFFLIRFKVDWLVFWRFDLI
jgi:hypothetical protein